MIIPFYNAIGAQRINSGGGAVPLVNTKSLAFDGVDDYMTTDATVGGGDFSLSYWVNANGSYAVHSDFNPVSIKPSDDHVNRSIGRLSTIGATLYPGLQAYDSTDPIDPLSYSTWTARALDFDGAGWHHIVWTFNNTNQNVYCYVDGVVQTFTNYSGTATTPYLISRGGGGSILLTYSDLTIGATWVPNKLYPGLLDEVAIFDYVLTEPQALEIFEATSTGETADLTSLSPVAWYRMGDNSTYQAPQILMPENLNKDKASNYSMAFDGTDDYIDCGNISDLNGVTTATWSGWFNRAAAGSFYIMSTWGTTSGTRQFLVLQSATAMTVYMANSAGSQQTMNTISYSFSVDTWYHLAFVYNEAEGSNADKMKVYVNGALQANTVAGAALTTLNSSTANFEIGKIGGYTTNEFNGKIDEVAIFNSVIDVATLYNSGTPNDITSLSPIGYWKLGEGSKFTSQWLVPNQMSQDTAFDFDGSTDIILCQSDLAGNLNQIDGAISVSAWVRTTQGAVYEYIVSRDRTGGGDRDWNLFKDNHYPTAATGGAPFWSLFNTNSDNLAVRLISANDPAGDPIIPINDGNWHHVVGVYDGSDTCNLYTDGVLQGTTTLAGFGSFPLNKSARVCIGGHNNGSLPTNLIPSWEGGISNTAIWDSALSPANVLTIYNNGTPDDITSLLPFSWWKLDDSATFENTNWIIPDATITPTYTEGLFWGGGYVGGSPSVGYANMSLTNKVVSASDITYSCWYKLILPTTGNSDRIFGTGHPYLGHIDATPADIIKWNGDTATEYINFGNAGIADGAWHHILIYHPNTSSIVSTDVQCFVDGKEIAQTYAGPSNPFTATTGPVTTINGSFSSGTTPLNTVLSNWAYWLSNQISNIDTIYNEGTPGDISSLSPDVWLKYDAATTALTGSSGLNYGVATDSSGNNNHGNIAGGTDSVGNIATELRTTNVQAENGVSSAMTQANLVRTPISFSNVYSKFSFDFDGTDDKIDLLTCTTHSADISVSFWMKAPAQGLTNIFGGGGIFQYFGSLNTAGTLMIYDTGGSPAWKGVVAGAFDDTWHHIVITRESGTNTIKGYKDSILLSTTVFSNAFLNNVICRMGSYSTTRFYNGILNEVSLYNSTIDQTKINELFNGGQPKEITGAIAHWRMGEDSYYNATVGVSGNTTADAIALQLNDGGATFLSDNISIGDLVRNTTDDTITHIAAIVSDTQINIDDDIFPVGSSSGDGYKITGPVVWTVPDQVGSNDGTSTNMSIQDLQGDAPNYSGAGTSSNMYIEDRVGNAPNSENNAVSYNMYPDDIDPDVP